MKLAATALSVALGWIAAPARAADDPAAAAATRFVETVHRGDLDNSLHALDAALEAANAQGKSLQIPEDRAVVALWRALQNRPDDLDHLMNDLDGGDWSPVNPAQDPSLFWRRYCVRLLEAHRTADAIRVSRRVTGASDLLHMRLDNRFAPVLTAQTDHFDVRAAVNEALERDNRLYAGPGGNSDALYAMVDHLRLLGRFDEALEVTATALAYPSVVDGQGHDHRNWIEDRRAYVLFNMGRFDEAIAQETSAAGHDESGRPNVSNTINLAAMLNGVGRHAEALAAVEPLAFGQTSPYGYMWVAAEQACAAFALGRDSLARAALQYTESHLAENRSARVKALLCADDLTGAAKVYVGWLDDPAASADALVQLSDFTPTAKGVFDTQLSERFARVKQDPAVQVAIGRVGHTETVRLSGVWRDF